MSCMSMKVKSRRSKKRASSPLKKISSIVKALAAKYRKEGKKIKLSDAFDAMWTLIKYRFNDYWQ